MSQLNYVKNETNPDQIYYDLTVSNFQSTTEAPKPFYFNESRANPFVLVPEDYYLSILRFTVDTGTIPVFIPSIVPNQANKDLTIYKVSMTFTYGTRFVAQNSVIWIPQDRSAVAPVAPINSANGLQINDTGYYNCYNYQYWCYLVYKALQTCMAEILASPEWVAYLAATALPVPPFYAPIINWDSSSSKAIIYAQTTIFNLGDEAGVNPQAIRIYMNAPLYSIYGSLPALHLGYNNTQELNYLLTIVDIGGTNSSLLIPDAAVPSVFYSAITISQEVSTTSEWTPITALVFTSTTLQINPNQVSTPLVYANNQIVFGGNNSASAPIITDLVSETGNYSPNVVYTPTSQYRLLTLYGNSPLSNLDIGIYYRLRNGSLVPFTLQSGGTVTMKIAFLKKGSTLKY